MLSILLSYCVVGAIAGVLAGLLGIGGGLVIVPMLVFLFSRQAMCPEIIMHLALGTSMATIIFTSISSVRAHHKRGAVHWPVVGKITPGIFTGTLLGTWLVASLSTLFLKIFFILFLYVVAAQMLLNRKPKAARQLPGHVGIFGVGNGIGLVSSLVGIGGGSMSVPFLLWCNVVIHHAIATSAAIGFPIAIAGTIGYLLNGWGNTSLPGYSVGFIYLPALLGIAGVSFCTAPIGVKLAHSLPVDKLKRVFAILLLVVASKMLLAVIG